jgi:hypothetical protein
MATLWACVKLQKRLERPAAPWTWLLWVWPASAAWACVRYDADMVHAVAPVLCILGILVAGWWSVVGDVPFERLARPVPTAWWAGMLAVVPQGVGAIRDVRWRSMPPELGKRLALGLLLSVPLLILFGSLLTADQAFSEFLNGWLDRLSLDWVPPVARLALFWALALGWLRVLTHQDTVAPAPLDEASQADPLVLAIPIGLLNVLFATFLMVQSEYLFGGLRYASRPNLAYSTYLHQGYFELVAVTVLALMVVAIVYRFSYRQAGGGWPLGLSGLLLVQCYGVAASAWQRFDIYTSAYGLTVLRIYAGLGLVVACTLMAVVLYGILMRRNLAWLLARFSLALALTVPLVCGLDVEGWIARYNVPAMLAHQIPADYDYLASLSGDALPAMVSGMDAADPQSRPALQHAISAVKSRCGCDWQDFNYARWRAY